MDAAWAAAAGPAAAAGGAARPAADPGGGACRAARGDLQVVLVVPEGVQVGRAVVQGGLDASGALVGRGEAADGDQAVATVAASAAALRRAVRA